MIMPAVSWIIRQSNETVWCDGPVDALQTKRHQVEYRSSSLLKLSECMPD
jgi:hypothetical protein